MFLLSLILAFGSASAQTVCVGDYTVFKSTGSGICTQSGNHHTSNIPTISCDGWSAFEGLNCDELQGRLFINGILDTIIDAGLTKISAHPTMVSSSSGDGMIMIYDNMNLVSANFLSTLEVEATYFKNNPKLVASGPVSSKTLYISGTGYHPWASVAPTFLSGATTLDELTFDRTLFTDFSFLSNTGITTIHGALEITENSQLTSLNGLQGITSVGSLSVSMNNLLPDLYGLNGLTQVGSPSSPTWLSMYHNGKNSGSSFSLDGLNALHSVYGALLLSDACPGTRIRQAHPYRSNGLSALSSLVKVTAIEINCLTGLQTLQGLEGIQTLQDFTTGTGSSARSYRALKLYTNYALADVSALSGMTRVDGHLIVAGVPAQLPFSALTSVEKLWIQYSGITDLCGLSSLTTIRDELLIISSSGFVSFCETAELPLTTIGQGLGDYNTYTGKFHLGNLDSFVSFKGLGNLEKVPHFFQGNNRYLLSYTGLTSLVSIEALATGGRYYNSPIVQGTKYSESCHLTSFVGLEAVTRIGYAGILGCTLDNVRGLQNWATVQNGFAMQSSVADTSTYTFSSLYDVPLTDADGDGDVDDSRRVAITQICQLVPGHFGVSDGTFTSPCNYLPVQPGTTCGVPTQTHEVFDAYLKQSSGLSIIGGTPKLTLDVSFSRTHYLNATNPLTFLECVDANGDFVQPPFSPAANTIQYDPDNGCNRVVTVSIDYLDYCNFNVEDSADGTTTVFSGELTLNTAIDFTTPFQFTRYNRYPLLFFITFDRTFSVTTNIEVFNPNQCEDSTDCNGYPCIMFPEEGIKKCNCTDENGLGSNSGEHCEVDGQCPTFFNCPDGTVTVVPLVTALPGQLNQVLNNVPTYADNQLTGQIYAERSINGVSLTTSPAGTDDLLTYNFPLGVTGVTYTARDETGNECECNFQVNVTDALAPVVDCPPDLITNVWNSWAEPSGTDLIDDNIHFWITITNSNGNSQTITTTTTEAPTTTTTTTTTEAPQDLWDCNCASVLGEANVWSDYSPYDSYTLDTSAGDIQRVASAENGCPSSPYTAADFPTVSQVASFMVDRTPNAHTLWAFENTMTFQGNSAIAHGIFCPTVDPNFWYNAGEDAFIWYNNGEWSIGKPSVYWVADTTSTTTCATYDSNVCGSG